MDRHRRHRSESGATLVLALVFMVACALLVIPLAGLSATNLRDTSTLAPQRHIQFAGDGAMDLAIESVRYSATQGYPGGGCASIPLSSTNPPQLINGQTVRIDCIAQIPTNTSDSRLVQFYVCPTGTATDCPGQFLVSAQVSFRDFCPLTAHTDTATVTSGNATVADRSISAGDHGKTVVGGGIPSNTYVGTVTPGTSFLLSSSPTSQVNVTATANGSSVTIGALDPSCTFGGKVDTGYSATLLSWTVKNS
jgi:hypothetical protein